MFERFSGPIRGMDKQMICVSIGRGRHKHVIAEHRHLVDEGAQLVELRLDYIDREINLKRILSERPGPVIVTVRREKDGGKWTGSEEARQMVLRTAIAEGVEYVDLEEDVAGLIPRFGKTKRIVSMHSFDGTPSNLETIHNRLSRLDSDIVKLATMANSPLDNVRMLRLVKNSKVPTVGMCMGEMGTPSRILAAKFGAPFAYATFHHERTLAPGQLSFRQMTDIYHYDQINRETEVFGVIADPIGHSLSPVIHNAAFRELGMNRVYVPFRVPESELEAFLAHCDELGIKGLSVTIPHKETVVPHCCRVDGAVKGIGAANTLLFSPEGLLAFNTDYRAAMDSLDQALGHTAGQEVHPLQGKTAMLLGGGGVAKAIAYGLKRRGARVVVAARNPAKVAAMVKLLNCQVVGWDSRHTITPHVLVNCTPIGMHPNVDESPFEKRRLRPTMTVFDTVYNPEQTLLIKEAREQGCSVVTGVDMFVRQASLQFRHFTDQEAPAATMREVLKRATGPVKQ